MLKESIFYLFLVLAVAILVSPGSVSAESLFRSLRMGDRGSDVNLLQKILNNDQRTVVAAVGAGSQGNETSYFGTATKNAVIAFQELYSAELLLPLGLSRGTGYVGTLTLKKLNGILQLQQVATSTGTSTATSSLVQAGTSVALAPVITFLSTTTIQNGDMITIYGNNFTPLNTVILSIDFDNKFSNIISTSSTSMNVVLESSLSESFKKHISKYTPAIQNAIIEKIRSKKASDPEKKGSWYIPATLSVKTTAGTSNAVPILFNILKI